MGRDNDVRVTFLSVEKDRESWIHVLIFEYMARCILILNAVSIFVSAGINNDLGLCDQLKESHIFPEEVYTSELHDVIPYCKAYLYPPQL